ncbi:Lipid A export ATP-binding/permease protein MsbA [Pseudonocardia sp. Ae717_Ps2]|uniref:ABC transporter ATP-binding protein n=1 Tax=Pseudonocardia sp. Ae717_Ps2 TaxID=1885573 RepID=UPI00094AD0D6|nr:ABC transporter ATP-binding protein [Pseudonocardia sp. Ae717_Ps2]OLM32134.1 Lipid A export ATP-binding/permease protein MsbA [Pseudonocardia sp. Ae717_Ps2]
MSDGTTEITAQDTAEDTANGTADGTARSGGPRATARRVAGLFAAHRAAAALIVGLGLVATATNLLGPVLLGRATDLVAAGLIGRSVGPDTTKEQVVAGLRASGDETLAQVAGTVDFTPGAGVDMAALAAVLTVAAVLFVGSALLARRQGRVVARVVQRILLDLRERLARKISRMPLAELDRTPRGDLLSRVTNDVDNLQQSLQLAVGQLFVTVANVVGVVVVMAVLSPTLAAVVVVAVPVAAVLAARAARRAQPRFAELWQATGAVTTHVEQAYGGHALVSSMRRQQAVAEEFDRHNRALREAERRAQAVTGTIEPSTRFVTDLAYVLVVVVGALQVTAGAMTIGGVQAFTQLVMIFSRPVVSLAGFSAQIQSGLASAERVFALLDAPEQSADPVDPARPATVRGLVEFDRVGFRYRPDTPLIEDLSLRVEPGCTVAVVGATGAGKTTLGNLLLRFHEPHAGRVLLDGVDVATMARDELRRMIGVVPQEPWLFGGTIAENIAYGRPDASREEVVAAARATCVDEMVRRLPDGYDTVVDVDRPGVSAGERQLITLARAYLSDPAVLLLDEATSSIDTRTEVLVQEAMAAVRRGRTGFVIAHRLSTVRAADLIVVMDAGRILERGSHAELLARGGAYARLHAAGTTADDASGVLPAAAGVDSGQGDGAQIRTP